MTLCSHVPAAPEPSIDGAGPLWHKPQSCSPLSQVSEVKGRSIVADHSLLTSDFLFFGVNLKKGPGLRLSRTALM